jgi:hypothetical protein
VKRRSAAATPNASSSMTSPASQMATSSGIDSHAVSRPA